MAFFEELGNKVSQVGSRLADSARNSSQISHLDADIRNMQNQIDDTFHSLGIAYYNKVKNPDGPEPNYAQMIDYIDRLIVQQRAAIAENDRLHGVIRCAGCGSPVGIGTPYCPTCGRPMPIPQQPMMPGQPPMQGQPMMQNQQVMPGQQPMQGQPMMQNPQMMPGQQPMQGQPMMQNPQAMPGQPPVQEPQTAPEQQPESDPETNL